MRLRVDKFGFGLAIVAIMFSFLCMFVLGIEISAHVPSYIALGSWSFYLFTSLTIGFLLLAYVSPRLRIFRPYKSRRYDLVPIYYSLNGPRKSDAVVCRVREAGKENNRWDLRIVPLSAFSSEDRYNISILFNDTTGAPMVLEDSFLISARKTYNRNLLTVANKEKIVKDDKPKPAE